MNERLKLKMTEVLVVGAGPAGLATAITLARRGISCVVVDRRRDVAPLSLVTVQSLRTMELLRSWGLEEAVRAHGVDVEWQQLVCETLAPAGTGRVFPVGYPTPTQSAMVSPTEPACVRQDHVETVLLDHLCSLDSAHVIRGTEIIGLDNGSDGIRAALRDTATGRTQLVDARYLAAADGAHSAVRTSLGIAMRGPEDADDRRQRRMEHSGRAVEETQLADTFRRDSVFLVGDAAYCVTPRGGTGMNIAIHGGFDLGWKLAWVLRGWAAAELLDAYESDRRPAVEHSFARSIDPDGTNRHALDEFAADLGRRIPHVWVPTPAGRVSTLDMLGSGLTLFTGPDSAVWEVAATAVRDSPPIDVRRLDALSARSMGIRQGAALLARPDGVPIGSWTAGSGAAATAAVASAVAGICRRPNGRFLSPASVNRELRAAAESLGNTSSRVGGPVGSDNGEVAIVRV